MHVRNRTSVRSLAREAEEDRIPLFPRTTNLDKTTTNYSTPALRCNTVVSLLLRLLPTERRLEVMGRGFDRCAGRNSTRFQNDGCSSSMTGRKIEHGWRLGGCRSPGGYHIPNTFDSLYLPRASSPFLTILLSPLSPTLSTYPLFQSLLHALTLSFVPSSLFLSVTQPFLPLPLNFLASAEGTLFLFSLSLELFHFNFCTSFFHFHTCAHSFSPSTPLLTS